MLTELSCLHYIFPCKAFALDCPQACPACCPLINLKQKNNTNSERAAESRRLIWQRLSSGTHIPVFKAISKLNDHCKLPLFCSITEVSATPISLIKSAAGCLTSELPCVVWYQKTAPQIDSQRNHFLLLFYLFL